MPNMTQERALEIMLEGRNVFLTGPPGSGKTYLLKQFIKEATDRAKNVAVTATTGIAATHLSGQTINSWAGIGSGKRLKYINQSALKDKINATDALVIDEISMMDSKTFDLIDIICKLQRKSTEPFGGLQLILTGDFFQLPPVSKANEKPKYVYRSMAWSDMNMNICYLDEQFRQKSSDDLIKILLAIRQGEFGEVEQKIVSKRMFKMPNNNRVLKLMSHNYDVEQINRQELAVLPGKLQIYIARSYGHTYSLEILKSNVLAPEKLGIKLNSEVMFVVNNPSAGYVNGSRGIVRDLKKDSIIIKLQSGSYINLRRHRFILDSHIYPAAYIEQFPIKLSWALTIHKSQGMTLSKALIDLSHCFLPNMGYVALSRLQSIDGLYLKDFNKMAFLTNSDIRAVDEQFRQLSAKLSA